MRNALHVLRNFLLMERWIFRRCCRKQTHQNWMLILRKLLTEKDSDIPISYIFTLKLFEVRGCWCWWNCWLSLFNLCFHNTIITGYAGQNSRRYMTSSRFLYQTRNDRTQLNVWGSMQDCISYSSEGSNAPLVCIINRKNLLKIGPHWVPIKDTKENLILPSFL